MFVWTVNESVGRMEEMLIPDMKYTRVRLNSLPAGQAIPFDLFVLIGSKYIHYLRAGDKLEASKLHSFEKKAPEAFFVKIEEREKYKIFVHDLITGDELR